MTKAAGLAQCRHLMKYNQRKTLINQLKYVTHLQYIGLTVVCRSPFFFNERMLRVRFQMKKTMTHIISKAAAAHAMPIIRERLEPLAELLAEFCWFEMGSGFLVVPGGIVVVWADIGFVVVDIDEEAGVEAKLDLTVDVEAGGVLVDSTERSGMVVSM